MVQKAGSFLYHFFILVQIYKRFIRRIVKQSSRNEYNIYQIRQTSGRMQEITEKRRIKHGKSND